MKFKNILEEKAFAIAKDILGDTVTIEHNKTIQIENALFPEVASFTGPPKKEIDVLAVELASSPRIILLVSCKLFTRRASPAHVQEWCSVVQTMNKYANETLYLGLVIAPIGFSSGCESWASAHNIGLIPPLKGKQLVFSEESFYQMFSRTLIALKNRIHIHFSDLGEAPAFFNFVYNLVGDFEGHEETVSDKRFCVMPQKWASSFMEMYTAVQGKIVKDLFTSGKAGIIEFNDGTTIKVNATTIEIWHANPKILTRSASHCRKNIEMEPCALDEVLSLVKGLSITSAADFGMYLELGVDARFNLGIHPEGFHVFSTEMPIDKHKL